jgi:hypothetical protein
VISVVVRKMKQAGKPKMKLNLQGWLSWDLAPYEGKQLIGLVYQRVLIIFATNGLVEILSHG